jgi:hypothetical protein
LNHSRGRFRTAPEIIAAKNRKSRKTGIHFCDFCAFLRLSLRLTFFNYYACIWTMRRKGRSVIPGNGLTTKFSRQKALSLSAALGDSSEPIKPRTSQSRYLHLPPIFQNSAQPSKQKSLADKHRSF